ncbi:MAG: hypothetical protein AAGI66_04335 [Cyanobacteria bacterium P01_H01_bin.74]
MNPTYSYSAVAPEIYTSYFAGSAPNPEHNVAVALQPNYSASNPAFNMQDYTTYYDERPVQYIQQNYTPYNARPPQETTPSSSLYSFSNSLEFPQTHSEQFRPYDSNQLTGFNAVPTYYSNPNVLSQPPRNYSDPVFQTNPVTDDYFPQPVYSSSNRYSAQNLATAGLLNQQNNPPNNAEPLSNSWPQHNTYSSQTNLRPPGTYYGAHMPESLASLLQQAESLAQQTMNDPMFSGSTGLDTTANFGQEISPGSGSGNHVTSVPYAPPSYGYGTPNYTGDTIPTKLLGPPGEGLISTDIMYMPIA